ncbi:MAG: TlpA disulfide reductase family protein [Bacteroidales bacterium]
MKKTIFSNFVLILISAALPAQNVTLKGKATGAEGKKLDVFAWSDQLTYKQTKIASGKIDSAGKFNFSFKTDETIFTYVKVDFNQAPLYIEPGKTYDLSISCPDCNSPDDKTNPYLDPKSLSVVISNYDSTELNNRIIQFNADYDSFIWNNYVSLIRQRNKSKIDTFKANVNKRFGSVKNEYLSNLIRYRIATIEQMAQIAGSETLSKEYLWKQPVLYNNTGYMEFFNEFFKSYIISGSKYITENDLYRTINQEKSFPALMDSLGKDSILRNEVVRELVALKGLGEMYYSQEFDKTAILGMFKYISEKSKFPQHRLAAVNYMNFLTKLAAGTTAPAFTLKDFNGQTYSLSEFNKDKYVCLIFWTTWCVPCIAEMDLIGKLKEKYGTKVEFVGISTDKEFLTYYYFMQNNKKFNFTTLHWGNNTDLMENYNVKAYPAFILIGPDGKIVQSPAEPPSADLDALLFDLTKIAKKK